MKLPDDIREYFRRQGKIGAAKRSANLSPERRSEIARKAVETRWAKIKGESSARKTNKKKAAGGTG